VRGPVGLGGSGSFNEDCVGWGEVCGGGRGGPGTAVIDGGDGDKGDSMAVSSTGKGNGRERSVFNWLGGELDELRLAGGEMGVSLKLSAAVLVPITPPLLVLTEQIAAAA